MINREIYNINASIHFVNLKVNTPKGILFVPTYQILYIRAENKHSDIYFVDSKKIKTNHLLKWYVSHLPECDFYRCHKSFIVNCHCIDYIIGYYLIMNGEFYIPLSRNKKQYLENLLLNYL